MHSPFACFFGCLKRMDGSPSSEAGAEEPRVGLGLCFLDLLDSSVDSVVSEASASS